MYSDCLQFPFSTQTSRRHDVDVEYSDVDEILCAPRPWRGRDCFSSISTPLFYSDATVNFDLQIREEHSQPNEPLTWHAVIVLQRASFGGEVFD